MRQQLSGEFTARPAAIPVNNGSNLDDEQRLQMQLAVMNYLLTPADDENADEDKIDEAMSPKRTKLDWRAGRLNVSIGAVATGAFNDVQRHLLKAQGNGVATFLRNHRLIFTLNDGVVSLRDYRQQPPPPPSAATTKRRPCWFNSHHPDGCPLKDQCALEHL